MNNQRKKINLGIIIIVFALLICSKINAQTITGELKVWHKVILTIDGPQTSEYAIPNPFSYYRMTVTFSQGSKKYIVPGFFAANGDAGNTSDSTGSKWRAYFCPDNVGQWDYSVSFKQGDNVAIAATNEAGTPVLGVDGIIGSFNITSSDKSGDDFRHRGMLKYIGTRYLQFAGDSSYFLKGGEDSPENVLGYYEFDNTIDYGNNGDEVATPDHLHHFEPHSIDYDSIDAAAYTWQNGKGKNILGLMNYLNSQKINSIYFLTYNVDGGDGRDTYPWTNGATERMRYDCSKLDQWEQVFSYMDKKGIQLHIVLTEAENCKKLDGGDVFGNQRKLYYRELIARFAHHLAVEWNIGEEVSNSIANLKSFSTWIKTIDPYKHPVAVHTMMNKVIERYDALKGHPDLDATSIQGSAINYNTWASQISEFTLAAGHPMVVFGDENSPALLPDMGNVATLRKDGLWGNLMGGGSGCEWYFGYKVGFGDINTEDLRQASDMWASTRPALNFFQSYLPFTSMSPSNWLVSGVTTPTDGYCFSSIGKVYAIYLKKGGTAMLDLSFYTGKSFTIKWFNPRNGGILVDGTIPQVIGGSVVGLGYPPVDLNLDWAILVSTTETNNSETNIPSTPQNITFSNVTSSKVDLHWDASTDDSGIAGYIIFRDGLQCGSSSTPFFSDQGLNSNTHFSYTVKAVDIYGNISVSSIPLIVTTNAGSLNVIESVTLINADTDLPFANYDPIHENDSINFNFLGTTHLNIRVNVTAAVGSIKFVLDGISVRTESTAPYAIGGDTNGDYAAWSPSLGIHVLEVFAYSSSGATGTQIGNLSLVFYTLNLTSASLDANNNRNWKISPVPFNNRLKISNITSTSQYILLKDTQGRVLKKQKVYDGEANFESLCNLAKGVYFLEDEVNRKTEKIVKY